MSQRLSKKDYALWIISVIAMFFIFEALGNFGNLTALSSASPISLAEKSLFKITYIAAGGVFAIFMGSLIFLSLRFRERSEVSVQRKIDYSAISLATLIVTGIILVWFSLPYLSPNIPLVLQFNSGILISMAMFLLFALTIVLYKEYYKD
ncbi:hypothetical protein [Sulfurisphaera ohwakuensis]|uniref:Putative membrane protein n=1 Tax=Sulfurisphaera ohwakuensis TaxID=69656 RepID=A0A650CKQ7_SULOH|nr:hypothetical protein [Sulfurisphaera ohwakuensis]MBB5253675.1 putative membrane protein [Sulfurisphaera ohwakuensis]QGR18342.1 hypothetical protein D1869_14935 [Sulfurisphaera ohwakuensis]